MRKRSCRKTHAAVHKDRCVAWARAGAETRTVIGRVYIVAEVKSGGARVECREEADASNGRRWHPRQA